MKITARLALLLLTAMLLFVFLTPAVQAEAIAEITYLLQGMENIIPVEQTPYLLVQSQNQGLWGVYNTSGEQLIAEAYENLSYLGYGCFETSYADDPLLNWKALVAPNGDMLGGYDYGVITVYNPYWAVGLWVYEGSENEYDLSPSEGVYCLIDRCDVFWLGESPRKVGRLNQDQFLQAAAHGQYLSVEDRDGVVTVYDQNFLPVEGFAAESLSDSVYGVFSYALMDRAKGEIIMDGVSAAKEVQTSRGRLYQVTRVTYNGNKQYGICDENGVWLLPPGDDRISAIGADYAEITRDGLKGLYSYDQGRLVVPCEYDKFVTNDASLDPYVSYGYVCAIKDKTRHFINVKTGEVESTVAFNSKTMTSLGGTVYRQTATDLFWIHPASGPEWYMENAQMQPTRGDGSLLVFFSLDAYAYGVSTMDGETALNYWYVNAPVITDDGKVIIKTTTNACVLMELTW